MSNPLPRNLIPLAEKHIKDTGKKILASGKVTNGKRGIRHDVDNSVYDYGLVLWRGGFIKRKSGHYYLIPNWYGMPYPYKQGLDLRDTL